MHMQIGITGSHCGAYTLNDIVIICGPEKSYICGPEKSLFMLNTNGQPFSICADSMAISNLLLDERKYYGEYSP